MRFCVPIPCFFSDIDFCDALRRVASLGFDAAETYDWTRLDQLAVRDAQAETGVELLSMCTTFFNLTDDKYRPEYLSGIEKTLAAAKVMGVKKLITQVGQDTGAPRERQHENIVSTLRLAVPMLEEAGVTLMIEPLNTIYDHKGYYLWSAVEGFDIVRAIDSPNVRLIFDIYHQQVMEGNIINNITENLDLIAHLHCAGHPGRIELQLGESDYKKIFSAVDRAGYKGACGLEYRPTMGAEASLRAFRKIYMEA